MSDLFDYAESQRLRDIGIEKVTSYPNDEYVMRARAFAVSYARKYGKVTSDDVQREMPIPSGIHPNATGGIFKTKDLMVIGMTQTHRISGRARRILVYAPAQVET
jgi:hypothetical protein